MVVWSPCFILTRNRRWRRRRNAPAIGLLSRIGASPQNDLHLDWQTPSLGRSHCTPGHLASRADTRIAQLSEVRAKRFGVLKWEGHFSNKYEQLRVGLEPSRGLNKVLKTVMTITFVKTHDSYAHLLA
jgi:hypothetical protein